MRRVPRSIIEVAVAVVTLLSALNVGASPSYLESRTQVAVGLFADRGLGAPHVSSVTFDPDDPFCGRYGGRYDAADASILLCFDSGTLIRDEGEPLHPV